jgi:hypothetical protein
VSVAATPARSPYIVGPAYDWAFFLAPPTVALALGIAISGSAASTRTFALGPNETTLTGLLIGALIHAHLVAVFVRSHGNRDVFRLHRVRFLLVPLVVWLAIVISPWIAVAAAVVATFWDVWHSGAQTFGFARIYDRNAGRAPTDGRRLDFWLNQLLYAGPVLGGVSLLDHTEVLADFDGFDDPFAALLATVPAEAEGHASTLTVVVLAAGTLFVAYYVFANVRLAKRGRGPSLLSVVLVASTGLCSIYTWGFNSWGEAFFIMNFFHAVQYLGLVWAVEKRNMLRTLRLEGRRHGTSILLALYLGSVLAYGFGVELMDPELTSLWALTMVVSLMHFWYDAFIWSVRKKQI